MSEWLRWRIPAECELRRELKVIAGLMAGALVFSLFFLTCYSDWHARLYMSRGTDRILMPGAVMPQFDEVYAGNRTQLGFAVALLCMAVIAARYYMLHRQGGSRSDYLMRRLPDRWEYARRCVTLPLLGALAVIAEFVIVTLIYFAVYALVTPEVCLPAGWQDGLWRVILCWR